MRSAPGVSGRKRRRAPDRISAHPITDISDTLKSPAFSTGLFLVSGSLEYPVRLPPGNSLDKYGNLWNTEKNAGGPAAGREKGGDPMTNEQLVLRIQAGESPAQNMAELYEQIKGFIHAVAWKYRHSGELEDLEQEGYLALCDAVEGYKETRGTAFLTYAAYHLHGRMQRYLQTSGRVLRQSAGREAAVQKYKRLCSTFDMRYGREPSEAEAAALLGLSPEQIRRIASDASMTAVASLDSPVCNGEESEGGLLGDMLASEEEPEAEVLERVQRDQLRAVLWPLVDRLPGKQPAILRRHYQAGMTLRQIGQQSGLTPEAVQYEERRALHSLQHPSVRRRLLPFLEDSMQYGRALRGTGVQRFRETWTSATEREALLSYEKRGAVAGGTARREAGASEG